MAPQYFFGYLLVIATFASFGIAILLGLIAILKIATGGGRYRGYPQALFALFVSAGGCVAMGLSVFLLSGAPQNFPSPPTHRHNFAKNYKKPRGAETLRATARLSALKWIRKPGEPGINEQLSSAFETFQIQLSDFAGRVAAECAPDATIKITEIAPGDFEDDVTFEFVFVKVPAKNRAAAFQKLCDRTRLLLQETFLSYVTNTSDITVDPR